MKTSNLNRVARLGVCRSTTSRRPSPRAILRKLETVFALHPKDRNLAPKVQAFVEFVVDAFRPDPPWDIQTRRNTAKPAPAPTNSPPATRPIQREA